MCSTNDIARCLLWRHGTEQPATQASHLKEWRTSNRLFYHSRGSTESHILCYSNILSLPRRQKEDAYKIIMQTIMIIISVLTGVRFSFCFSLSHFFVLLFAYRNFFRNQGKKLNKRYAFLYSFFHFHISYDY